MLSLLALQPCGRWAGRDHSAAAVAVRRLRAFHLERLQAVLLHAPEHLRGGSGPGMMLLLKVRHGDGLESVAALHMFSVRLR